MNKIWLVEYGYGEDHTAHAGAFADRGDAFGEYVTRVRDMFSSNQADVIAKDYDPGKNLMYSSGSDWVSLKGMDVTPKGGK